MFLFFFLAENFGTGAASADLVEQVSQAVSKINNTPPELQYSVYGWVRTSSRNNEGSAFASQLLPPSPRRPHQLQIRRRVSSTNFTMMLTCQHQTSTFLHGKVWSLQQHFAQQMPKRKPAALTLQFKRR